jgi:hypothetical protein
VTNQADKASEIRSQRDESARWMQDTYWTQWERVYKDYQCEVDQPLDSEGKVDLSRTAVGMPDTFALVNRMTARVTAQLPNISFVTPSGDQELSMRVSRKCMRDWDVGRVQRWQPVHVRQAKMFGWSVRSWTWERNEFLRQKRIDVRRQLSPVEMSAVAKQYGIDPRDTLALAAVLEAKGRGGLLPISYKYLGYEGPRSEVLFVGDCYPEPNFQTIQDSNWFIVEHRRNRRWLDDFVKLYPESAPQVEALLEKHPKGTDVQTGSRDVSFLRDRLRTAVNRPTDTETYRQGTHGSGFWTITERHSPGRRPKVAYSAEDHFFLGEVDYPFVLDGKIAFTELVFIDDILGGCGDSVARIVRGLQAMHNNTVNRRYDLIRHLSEPLIGTTDRHLYENPDLLRRDGMRLIYMRHGQGSLWTQPEQAAQAAVVSAMSEEGATLRLIQMASGDNNMSMAANVDPSQARTATGARLMAYNQDVLTKAYTEMFHQASVVEDARMIQLLNRSEMSEAVRFNAAPYHRNYEESSRQKEQWITAEPLDFQEDGEVVVELGSTLADDDEAKVAKADNLFAKLAGNPLVDQQRLVVDLLTAYGKGKDAQSYLAPQQEAPPPAAKASISASAKWELLTPGERAVFLQAAGIDPQQAQSVDDAMAQKANEQQMVDERAQLPPETAMEAMTA